MAIRGLPKATLEPRGHAQALVASSQLARPRKHYPLQEAPRQVSPSPLLSPTSPSQPPPTAAAVAAAATAATSITCRATGGNRPPAAARTRGDPPAGTGSAPLAGRSRSSQSEGRGGRAAIGYRSPDLPAVAAAAAGVVEGAAAAAASAASAALRAVLCSSRHTKNSWRSSSQYSSNEVGLTPVCASTHLGPDWRRRDAVRSRRELVRRRQRATAPLRFAAAASHAHILHIAIQCLFARVVLPAQRAAHQRASSDCPSFRVYLR